MKSVTFSVFLFCMALFSPVVLVAEVVVHDHIAVSGTHVTLEAETRGRFFKKGGVLVEFFLDEKSVGKNLSGGDGLAYKEIVAGTAGRIKIGAESGGDRGEGLLLILKKGTEIVCIDVEGSLTDEQFILKPKEGSTEAVGRIADRYPIIYLRTGLLGFGMIKKWLFENGFENAPLMPWNRGEVFDELHDMGIRVKAVIGSSAVIGSAADHKPLSFTFEDDDEDENVTNWKEIEEGLR